MSDTLARIVRDKQRHVAKTRRNLPEGKLLDAARSAPPVRGFRAALDRAATKGYGLIAEIKKASPSRGLIRADFDPPDLARAYAAGGATCLSVLTDSPYFQGEDAHLVRARDAVDLPVLRKDFTVDPYQVVEARALGADCILLIMAALDDVLAAELEAAAFDLRLDVLVETHDAEELDRALQLRSTLIGINNRNLKTLDVDLDTTIELAPRVPDGYRLVAESGLRTPADLDRMASVGARCFLVGEHLMNQPDVTAATRTLLGTQDPNP